MTRQDFEARVTQVTQELAAHRTVADQRTKLRAAVTDAVARLREAELELVVVESDPMIQHSPQTGRDARLLIGASLRHATRAAALLAQADGVA